MRLRIILLVVATSSLVLVSFLVPLALVLRNLAAARAVSAATAQAQSMTALVATLHPDSMRLAVDQVNAQARATPVTVFLPGGAEVGAPAPRSAAVLLAAKGRSFTTRTQGGVEVLVSVAGLPGGTAVIRTFVPQSELRRGVDQAWLLLGCVGIGLLVLSVAVANQLAQSLVRPLAAVAQASDRLATGDLDARATVTGPPEVRRMGAGLNRLAVRIGELLVHERETVADLSHRLRTPLTALRIDAESLRDSAERTQLLSDLDAVEGTVNEVIRQARRPTGDGRAAVCEAGQVIAERAAFWWPLAEDTDRQMTVDVAPGPILVQVPPGGPGGLRGHPAGERVHAYPGRRGVRHQAQPPRGGGAWLVVADDGPGFPHSDPTERGRSGVGSTGLGLDIARRIAESSGGTLTAGASASGGGSVTIGLGPPARPAERGRRHVRVRSRQRPPWEHAPEPLTPFPGDHFAAIRPGSRPRQTPASSPHPGRWAP